MEVTFKDEDRQLRHFDRLKYFIPTLIGYTCIISQENLRKILILEKCSNHNIIQSTYSKHKKKFNPQTL